MDILHLGDFLNIKVAFPNFKKKGKSDVKMYFVKNNPKDCRCERHRLNIPTLGWVRLKEKGYIPTTKDGWKIRSGTISIKAGRYYCHCCGAIKKDLKLSDRIYRCNCGYTRDRDLNAALNLRDALTYEIA